MMLWCELHNTSGLKGGGITNFDPTEYEKDLLWLNSISQVRPPPALRRTLPLHMRDMLCTNDSRQLALRCDNA